MVNGTSRGLAANAIASSARRKVASVRSVSSVTSINLSLRSAATASAGLSHISSADSVSSALAVWRGGAIGDQETRVESFGPPRWREPVAEVVQAIGGQAPTVALAQRRQVDAAGVQVVAHREHGFVADRREVDPLPIGVDRQQQARLLEAFADGGDPVVEPARARCRAARWRARRRGHWPADARACPGRPDARPGTPRHRCSGRLRVRRDAASALRGRHPHRAPRSATPSGVAAAAPCARCSRSCSSSPAITEPPPTSPATHRQRAAPAPRPC